MNEQRFQQIRMVMVNTTHPGNIGAAARAMKNMCLSELYIVDPKDYPAEKAVWRAAGAVDVLENAKVVSTLDEAIADCGLVVGTSARERRIPWPLVTPRECGERCWAEAGTHPVAIVFGREDRGLTNEELHKCNFHVHIPANPEYSSLNIGAALQVICYEIRMAYFAAKEGKELHFNDWDQPPANSASLENYYEHLQETLEQLKFIDPDHPRQTVTRLRRLFGRIRMDKMELSILRGMLTSIQNHIFHTDKKIKALENKPD
ncbi:tRNA (cytosine(32)/uridine(32)-2'-O)-methyltransferase TrmJ [Teredinibacter purpureus]|uniref:tRNA (cytosine(32)/uridine(32)-2'-O)-methyltransferase TrmJ n=1 Tax=Teredinibacter purpureus TaxID=2731756 RepID=UPI0005F7D30B|nr:tRNA (cytosine(32)/uridine(32)-2'-O)-methyltransferase TrmJ [Teredinibacter purpureus]